MADQSVPDAESLGMLVRDVNYELGMLDHAVRRWFDSAPLPNTESTSDECAWMELTVLHARNLLEFFRGPLDGRRKQDDVYAVHYVPDWRSEDDLTSLESEVKAANKWIMHLTETRARERDEQPSIDPVQIQAKVHQVWDRFQAMCDRTRFDFHDPSPTQRAGQQPGSSVWSTNTASIAASFQTD